MTEFKEGQRVKVEFEGVIERFCAHNGCTLIRDEPGFNHYVLLGSSEVKVTALGPAGWPPRVGDVWKGNGLEWFATGDDHVTPEVDCDGEAVAWHVSDFRALNPHLVRRRGE